MSEKTNLDKSLSPINVWSLALGSIIGWGAFVMPGDLFLRSAGPLGTAIGMVIGGLIMIIVAMSYGYLVQKYPVAGGEFAFTFIAFGKTNAFICAWFLGLSYLSVVPLNATALSLIGRYMFPGILQKYYLYSVAGWDVYLGEVLFASVALIIFAFTSIRGIKVSGKIQTFMALGLVASIVLLATVSIFSKDTSFANLVPLYSPENKPLSGILSVIAVAPWVYVGFDSIPQAAEEFNFEPKKALGIMIASIILGMLMYIAMNTVTAIIYPWSDFISQRPYWATGQAIETIMGQTGLVILGIALVCAILAGIIGFYMASSRLLLSMSRAKALPSWFGEIHPKYKTPRNSIIFILLVSLMAPWFGRQVLLWIVDMASIGAAIGYFYTATSALNILIKEGGSRIQKTYSLMGSIFSACFILLLVIPGVPTYLSFQSRVALLIWIFLGIVFYLFSWQSYKKNSNDTIIKLITNNSDE